MFSLINMVKHLSEIFSHQIFYYRVGHPAVPLPIHNKSIMKTIIHTLSILLLAFAFAAPAYSADNEKKKKKKPAPAAVRVPKAIELNEDQKAKVAALNTEFGPKLAACRKEFAGVITADQKKARAEAMKAAKAAGKKGKELREAAEAAFKVTEDQKQQLARCKKDMSALQKEIRTQFAAILTDDQKAKLKGGKKKQDK